MHAQTSKYRKIWKKIQDDIHISQHSQLVTFKLFENLKAPLHSSFLKYLKRCSMSSCVLLIELYPYTATFPQGISPLAVSAMKVLHLQERDTIQHSNLIFYSEIICTDTS